MTKKIIAITFIFICTSIAWAILGATVFPHNNCTEDQVQAAEAGSHKPIPKLREKQSNGAERHQADTHDRHDANGVHTARDHASSIKQ